jgi:hypothetical protein
MMRLRHPRRTLHVVMPGGTRCNFFDLRRRTSYAFVLVATLALLAAGCGGNSDKKANESYANSVCTAIGNWGKEVKSIATNFSSGISKSSLEAKVTQFGTATTNLISQIKAVPPPNTSEGQSAKKQIDQFVSQVETTTSKVKSTAAQIPANATAAQTASSLATLAPQLQTLASSAKSTVKAVQSAGGSLADAFKSVDACKNLGG